MKKRSKSLTAIGIAMIASTSVFGQSSSYNANTVPINGVNNAAFGWFSLISVPVGGGSNNSAFGISSLGFNTTGSRNTGCGLATLASNTTANDNSAFGYRAMQLSNTAFANCAFGSQALNTMASGSYNSGFGFQSLYNTTTGSSNVAIGRQALYTNVSGNNNVAVGSFALQLANGNGINTAIGGNSMLNTTTGVGNTSTGYNSLSANTSGNSNLALGGGAGPSNTSGSFNTYVGVGTGFTNSTGNNNTFLGINANAGVNGLTNATAIGNGAVVPASDEVRIGNNAPALLITSFLGWSQASDGRFKEKVQENVPGLDFITKLRPVTYIFNSKKLDEFTMQNMPDSIKRKMMDGIDYSKGETIVRTGFIAQEVEKTAKTIGYEFDGLNTPKNPTDHYSVTYSQFVVPLVKAVQEQQEMIENLKTANALQQQQIEELLNKTTAGIGTGPNDMSGFALSQNIPNPFTSETVIKYTLTSQTKTAALNVYDLSGKQITSFPLTEKGASSITITSEKLAAGIYIYSIVADGKIMDSKRMVVAEK